jgi:hypothetical protein
MLRIITWILQSEDTKLITKWAIWVAMLTKQFALNPPNHCGIRCKTDPSTVHDI